jgi:hypothetical protein
LQKTGAGLIVSGLYFLCILAFLFLFIKKQKSWTTAVFMGICNLLISLFLFFSVVAMQGV